LTITQAMADHPQTAAHGAASDPTPGAA
jgi:hypothetical protein